MTTQQCVTVTPTIQSGIVVRWFDDPFLMEHHRPTVSASRDGVMGHTGGYITGELFQAAWAAHEALARGQSVAHLETHRRQGLMWGPWLPVQRVHA